MANMAIGNFSATLLGHVNISTMISAGILVFSVGFLAQFFVVYARMLVLASCKQGLSQQVLAVAGLENRTIAAGHFSQLLQLADLCPQAGREDRSVRAVRIYFRFLSLVEPLANLFAPGLGSWLEGERQGCSHFAALVLDRRLILRRELMAQQALDSF